MNDAEKVNILIVDDRTENLLALESLLERPDVRIFKANSGNEALGYMLDHDFALVLLDVQMPEMDGFETATLMRGNVRTRHIPIIFITAINMEEQHVFKGYQTGAVDYLFKPLDPDILNSKVNVFLELYRQKKFLEKTGQKLERTVDELKKLNRRILEQQTAIIEQERLKVILQITGAATHELSHPLMNLLGYIELLRMNKDDPEKMDNHLNKIEKAGQKISEIVKKIQNIRFHETNSYLKKASLIQRPQMIKILAVDLSVPIYHTIESIFSKHDHVMFRKSEDIKDFMEILRNIPHDLVFIGTSMDEEQLFDVVHQLNSEQIDLPVVLIIPPEDVNRTKLILPAEGYEVLPEDKISDRSLLRIVKNTMEKSRLKREIIQTRLKMAELMNRDELTGLYHRKHFMSVLDRQLSYTVNQQSQLALCLLDIDQFKQINEKYSFPAGDMVLAQLGKLLKDWVRFSKLLFRFSGEEFAILLPDTGPEMAVHLAEQLMDMIHKFRFEYGLYQFHISIRIGIAMAMEGNYPSSGTLIARATQALEQARYSTDKRIVVLSI